MTHKKYFYPALLAGLFIILVLLTIPGGYFYGSYTDWLSQHVRLAETIRNACLEQKTLVPAFLPLGGGSNGYQFSYYGYLRPDILIGCLFPAVPMVYLLIGYMLTGYFCSVMLCYYWLGEHTQDKVSAFLGSLFFLTAACFFQTHRQIMFVNYMPFLLLALICVKKKRFQFLPLCMLMIYLNSFYYSIACLAVIGWYWLRQEGKGFWKHGFLQYLKTAFLSIGMAALLLVPTALVILEHRRSSDKLNLLEILGANAEMHSLLYSPYGMGLTAICLYLLLLGLCHKKYRMDSAMLLFVSFCGAAAWILNGTLYARAKILIPFVPLVVLQCAKLLNELRQKNLDWKLWPCFIAAVFLYFFRTKSTFPWMAADLGILIFIVLIHKVRCKETLLQARYTVSRILLCIMPCILFYQTMQREQFVRKEDVFTKDLALDSNLLKNGSPLYRCDNLTNILNTGNLVLDGNEQKSAMYSSISNEGYSSFYYDTLLSPVQINNRLAILPSSNPFLLNFLGVRYIETTQGNVPAGYQTVKTAETEDESTNDGRNNDTRHVLAENRSVLPVAYTTSSCMSESQFEKLGAYDRLDAITRFTIIPEGETVSDPDAVNDKSEAGNSTSDPLAASVGNTRGEHSVNNSTDTESKMKNYAPAFEDLQLPDTVQAERTDEGWLLNVKKDTNITLNLNQSLKDQILLLDFEVENLGKHAVVIDINQMRNKLSGPSAPYPNGNNTFHYQFSSSSQNGIDALDITFSKGKYLLKNINWHTYDMQNLFEKQYTAVENQTTETGEILSCQATLDEDGYFVTSIPVQNGMEIWVDGKNVPILTLNQAFAGVQLTKGAHDIRIRFHAPGQMAGFIITIISFLMYLLYALRVPVLFLLRMLKLKKELVLYCLSGGATTFVNYLIYFILLKTHVEYLAANTLAWAGAVVTAYLLNRRLVFHSRKHILQEFCSFVFLRFLTLLAENILLWIAVDSLGIPPLPSKIMVSVITVLSNYVLCKYKIFHKEEVNHG